MESGSGPAQPTPSASRRLTAGELAREAGTLPEFVERLVEADAIHPDPSGLHDVEDVARVRLIRALADGGIDVVDLMWVGRSEGLPLDTIARMWTATEPTGRTFAEFASSLGERGRDLAAIYAAFGLGVPLPATLMRRDEEAVITDFLDLWRMVDDRSEVVLRAAHIVGDGVRRIQEATLDLFDEVGGSPPQRLRRGLSQDEATRPSLRLTPVMSSLLVWLQARHSEHDVFERIVSYYESVLARAGRVGPRLVEQPAIAFVDLSGYTELTATAGDERAAQFATTLQALAEAAARAHRGRIVKLLGDGVMLRYASAVDAVESVRDLMFAIVEAGLPQAHAGLAAGPVVVRDGDVYGHVVNLAARIAGHAATGELLIHADVAELLPAARIETEDAGAAQLKGLADPVRLARVRLSP